MTPLGKANHIPHSHTPVSYPGLIKSGSRRTDNKNVTAIDHNFRRGCNYGTYRVERCARKSTYGCPSIRKSENPDQHSRADRPHSEQDDQGFQALVHAALQHSLARCAIRGCISTTTFLSSVSSSIDILSSSIASPLLSDIFFGGAHNSVVRFSA